jgi:hypothetical protein
MCLAFLTLDSSETPDQTILIGPTQKVCELELDGKCGYVKPNGVESDNASTIETYSSTYVFK